MRQEKEFKLEGLHCAACQAQVEQALQKLPGVERVAVSFLLNKLSLVFEDSLLTLPALAEAVTAAGYTLVLTPAAGEPVVSGGGQSEVASNDYTASSGTSSSPLSKTETAARRRLYSSFALLLPLMYLSMGPMLHLPLPGFLAGVEGASSLALSQFILAAAIALSQRQFFRSGWSGLRRGQANMDSLVALGSGAALLYGLLALYRLQYGQASQNLELVHEYRHKLYFESAAMILCLVGLGKFLEQKAKGKTTAVLSKLQALAPSTATRVTASGEHELVASSALQLGDLLFVRPGETIAADGYIVEGYTALDEATLTGESMPVEKGPEAPVFAATINKSAAFIFRISGLGEDTGLARIIRLVAEAAASKAPIARLADRIAAIFVPVVMSLALLCFVGWNLAGYGFEFALNMAVSVLVISCPCALGLATPVAVMVAVGRGAELGILFKSGAVLEQAQEIKAIVLDKTGTVTLGRPQIKEILPAPGIENKDLLRFAASLEAASEHPLAEAVVRQAELQGIKVKTPLLTRSLPGQGVVAEYEGLSCYGGNLKLLRSQLERSSLDSEQSLAYSADSSPAQSPATYFLTGAEVAELEARGESWAAAGLSVLYFFTSEQYLGMLGAADELRPSSQAAVQTWHKMGLKVYLLSGDNKAAATAVGRDLGLAADCVLAEVLPEAKAQQIESLRAAGMTVAMVGDGINDAPALAQADLGLAIGCGTEVALEAADIVLLRSELGDVTAALKLAQRSLRIIKENLFWAFFYNILGIPLAAGLLYPSLGLSLNPMIAAGAMSLSSLFVVGNALRLRRFKVEALEVKAVAKITVKMQIAGMSCAHCSQRVERALQALPGVEAVVDLEQAEATLQVAGAVAPAQLEQVVTALGYTVSKIWQL